LGDLEIPQKREAYIVAECCTQFPQKKLKMGMKMGKELKRIPNNYAHIVPDSF